MKRTGDFLFFEASQAADPVAHVAALTAEQLRGLSEFLKPLPDTGWPGVLKAQVTVEKAQRWEGRK